MRIVYIRLAIIIGLLSIILGAFGAHALKAVLTEQQLLSFETGVRYQMYQALFMLFVASTNLLNEKSKKYIISILIFGILFFSGSIYLLATQNLLGTNLKFLGPITPIGGVLIMVAWVLTALKIQQEKNNN